MRETVVRLVVALNILLPLAASFEIIDTSGDTLVHEGNEFTLQCAADSEFFTCTWHHIESGNKCTMLGGSAAGTQKCDMDPERYSWVAEDPSVCQITVSAASLEEDAGQYRCTLLYFPQDGSGQPEKAAADLQVSIARPARPILGGDLEVRFDEDVEQEEMAMTLIAGEARKLECSVESSLPKASLSFAMYEQGSEEPLEVFDIDSAADGENEDGTAFSNASAVFVPRTSDCGNFICCESAQFLEGDDPQEIYEKTCAKVKVQFPPQASSEPFGPYGFLAGEESTRIDLHFMANPVPTDNRAIWHVNPSNETMPGAESLVFQAGSVHDSGKYAAAPLNISGHHVTAGIVIYQLVEEDADFEYVLHVSNELGEQQYSFRLMDGRNMAVDDGYGDVDVDDQGDVIIVGAEGGDDDDDVDEAGISTGSIIGICIVVVAVAGIALCIFWAKSKEKMCFKPKTGEPKPKKEKKKKEKKNKKNKDDVETGLQEGDPLNRERPESEQHHQHAKSDDVD